MTPRGPCSPALFGPRSASSGDRAFAGHPMHSPSSVRCRGSSAVESSAHAQASCLDGRRGATHHNRSSSMDARSLGRCLPRCCARSAAVRNQVAARLHDDSRQSAESQGCARPCRDEPTPTFAPPVTASVVRPLHFGIHPSHARACDDALRLTRSSSSPRALRSSAESSCLSLARVFATIRATGASDERLFRWRTSCIPQPRIAAGLARGRRER